jgi:hypothetical protein
MSRPFDVRPDAAFAFRATFGGPEITPLGQAGYSHFGYVPSQGFHVTTQIPGIGANEGLPNGFSTHFKVNPYLK